VKTAGAATWLNLLQHDPPIGGADYAQAAEKIGCHRFPPLVIIDDIAIFDSAPHTVAAHFKRDSTMRRHRRLFNLAQNPFDKVLYGSSASLHNPYYGSVFGVAVAISLAGHEFFSGNRQSIRYRYYVGWLTSFARFDRLNRLRRNAGAPGKFRLRPSAIFSLYP